MVNIKNKNKLRLTYQLFWEYIKMKYWDQISKKKKKHLLLWCNQRLIFDCWLIGFCEMATAKIWLETCPQTKLYIHNCPLKSSILLNKSCNLILEIFHCTNFLADL